MTFDPGSAHPSCPRCGSRLTVPQGEGNFHCNMCSREFAYAVPSVEPEAANVEREKEKVQARVPPVGFVYGANGELVRGRA
jgi:tRNA(Ile2) C34 agmatinyltransferase TiaS